MRPALLAATVTALAACGDDGGSSIDAGTGIDAPACTLPAAIITCTVGDDAPCTAHCPQAYCHLFNQVGSVCTNACADAGDCPAGWSCNTMGRCRPPDPP
jgi:hypothetical protein